MSDSEPDDEQGYSDSFAKVAWEAGDTPLSLQFDDPYFARQDGRAETQHVFIRGNGLPERWQQRKAFTIAELGFGTGLNFFETLAAWQQAPGHCEKLTFVSFERYPMRTDDLTRSLRPWPDLRENVEVLLESWPPKPDAKALRAAFGNAKLELRLGDANDQISVWNGQADAWYLDGFSPAKNEDLWGQQLMSEVFKRTAVGGTFATYTAAGWVRRNLVAAGFEVEKVAGYGRKRDSLSGRRSRS